MSTIYDKVSRKSSSPSYMENIPNQPVVATSDGSSLAEDATPSNPTAEVSHRNALELEQYLNDASSALSVVDDVVLKQYLTQLDHLEILSKGDEQIGKDVILYKINKMVYEKDEYATEKFISVISAMTYADCSIFLIVDGFADHTDFYLGIKNADDEKTTRSVAETFRASIQGQFPGILMLDSSIVEAGKQRSAQDILIKSITDASSVSSYVGVPSYKDEDGTYTNANYIQGIEKLVFAMRGRRYTAVVLANNVIPASIAEIRQGYENLYTQLSAVATQQVAYSTNESLANAISRSKGTSKGTSHTVTDGSSTSQTSGTNSSHTDTYSKSKKGKLAKTASVMGSVLATVGGVAVMATGIGAPVGLGMVAAGAALGAAGASGKQKTEGYSDTKGTSKSDTKGENHSISDGSSYTETFTDTTGHTATVSEGKNFTLTLHNKHIEELQKRIDKQLERIAMCESTGLWAVATYFFSYNNDLATAETGATIFRSIMQGEASGVEMSGVNTWIGNHDSSIMKNVALLNNTICQFHHPVFNYQSQEGIPGIPVENSSLLSSKELSMLLSLPRKSVSGFPVVEYVSLAKEVVRHSCKQPKRPLLIGTIFDQGVEHPENSVKLDVKSLTQHVFVTGSTGCGKSETVYKLISEARHAGAKFLIIEPAKGEYKNVFGKVNVYGTNPQLMQLMRINPFRFPKGIHVLEHIDRLTEIFNVCWPMYAAMPAVLKKAMLQAYENCGWDFYTSINRFSDRHDIFPSFADLLVELEKAISTSSYSEEVKGNYTGSLVTRVESLTNGLNGEIFSVNEVSDEKLFDEDTIVDLSRVGSQETKALIMGILIMRLSEYRMSSAKEANQGLNHITVLEEAHNILKRTSSEQSMEGGNVAGKSVEMITNAIAEMRTYGEGFVIVDQSPTSVDPAAIKNTNTKIIMRLPDGDDRTISGKAAGMKESQIDEIAKLPTGVAVVYQNDWISPVLAKISMIDEGLRVECTSQPDNSRRAYSKKVLSDLINLLMKGRIKDEVLIESVDTLLNEVSTMGLPTQLYIQVINLIEEFEKTGKLEIWKDSSFPELSRLVSQLLGTKKEVEFIAGTVKDFKDLNQQIGELIASTIDASESLTINLQQCLLEDWGQGNETRRHIVNVWAEDFRKHIKG